MKEGVNIGGRWFLFQAKSLDDDGNGTSMFGLWMDGPYWLATGENEGGHLRIKARLLALQNTRWAKAMIDDLWDSSFGSTQAHN